MQQQYIVTYYLYYPKPSDSFRDKAYMIRAYATEEYARAAEQGIREQGYGVLCQAWVDIDE